MMCVIFLTHSVAHHERKVVSVFRDVLSIYPTFMHFITFFTPVLLVLYVLTSFSVLTVR